MIQRSPHLPSAPATPVVAPPSLCSTLRELSARTADYIATGRRLGLEPGEETITDINLLEMQRRHPGAIRVMKFTKQRESSETGADWEWWIGDPSRREWLPLRVQAKKLNRSLLYGNINHHSKSGSQIDLLVRAARAKDFIPLFCFYNPSDFPLLRRPAEWKRAADLAAIRRVGPEWGCAIAPAEGLHLMADKIRKKPEVVLRNAVPWHELVCLESEAAFDRPSLPMRTLDVLRATMIQAGTFFNDPWPDAVIRESVPAYVDAILDGNVPTEAPSGLAYVLVTTAGTDRG